MKRILLILALTSISFTYSYGNQNDSLFNKANAFYQEGNYTKAVALYDSIYKSGYQNFELLFNLGNSYFKTDDYAYAILFYERALQINPNDADARHNLDLTNTLITDQIPVIPEFAPAKAIKELVGIFDETTWTIINLALWFLFFALIFLLIKANHLGLKKLYFYLSLSVFILTVSTGYLGYRSYRTLTHSKSGIITSTNVNIKSSPEDDGKTLFVLHSGTKIRFQEKIGDWYQVSISDGSKGWIKSEDFEKI